MAFKQSALHTAVSMALTSVALAATATEIHSIGDFESYVHAADNGGYFVEVDDSFQNNFYEIELENTPLNGLQLYAAYNDEDTTALVNNHLVWNSGNIGSKKASSDAMLFAAYSKDGDVENNCLEIKSGAFYAKRKNDDGQSFGKFVAARSDNGNLINNKVTITGGYFYSNIDVVAADSAESSTHFQTAENNSVLIDGGTGGLKFAPYENFNDSDHPMVGERAAGIYGANVESGQAFNNSVTIKKLNGSAFAMLSGAFTDSGDAKNNSVTIVGSQNLVVSTLNGAHSASYDLEGVLDSNKVRVENSTLYFGSIASGENYFGGVTNGAVLISNSHLKPIHFFTGEDEEEIGNVSYITGGMSEGESGDFNISGNTVHLIDSQIDVEDWGEVHVYAGGSTWANVDVFNNKIILESAKDEFNANNYQKVNFWGARTYANAYDNSLILNHWRGAVGSVRNFDTIAFKNFLWQDGETLLKVNNEALIASTHLDVDVQSIRFEGKLEDHFGEKMALVQGNNEKLDFNPTYDNGQTIAIPSSLTEDSTGVIQNNPEENSVEFRLEGTVPSRQLELVSNNRNMGLFFVNHGAELILDNLDATSRDYHWGLRTFASIDGVQSNYSTKGHIDVHGFTAAAGLANSVMVGGNPLLLNLFVETGKGDYSEEMSYLNIDRRFSGEMKYYGAGLSARIKNPAGWYLEGSLRAGRMESDVKRGLIDSNGQGHGYELSGSYFGAHVGLGKIFEIGGDRKLDLFAKYFYTYLPDDSEDIAADGVNNRFDFDSVSSSRIRAGGRIYFPLQKSLWAYTGLAYQYDFTPDVRVEVNGQKIADGASMRGSMGIGSLGLRYKSDESPWVMDLKIRGYVGQREGVSGKAQVEYRF